MMGLTHHSTGAQKLKLPSGIPHNHMKLYDDDASNSFYLPSTGDYCVS